MGHPTDHPEPQLPTAARILTLQRLFLAFLLANGTGTVDDVTSRADSRKRFPANRGNWRGIALLLLMQAGLIEKTGERRKSVRRQRHCTFNYVWAVADVGKVLAFLRDTDPDRSG